jgi:hypothetical protein
VAPAGQSALHTARPYCVVASAPVCAFPAAHVRLAPDTVSVTAEGSDSHPHTTNRRLLDGALLVAVMLNDVPEAPTTVPVVKIVGVPIAIYQCTPDGLRNPIVCADVGLQFELVQLLSASSVIAPLAVPAMLFAHVAAPLEPLASIPDAPLFVFDVALYWTVFPVPPVQSHRNVAREPAPPIVKS